MIEQPRKRLESEEISPEKGWVLFLIRLRQEMVEKAHNLIKAKPKEEAIILAEVDMLDGTLKEIGETEPEGRRQLIENFWQEGKIPEDIYQKLVGRMETETEMEKLEAEAGLGKKAAKEKLTEQEAAQAVAETVEEIAQKNPFWKNLREKISGAGVKPREIYEAVSKTLQEKKVFGVSLLDHLKNMGTGAAVRTTARWGLGFLTGGAGYLLASGAGAVSGGILEGRKAYLKEKKVVGLSEEEFAKKLTEIKEKAGQDLKKRIDIYSEIVKNLETSNLSEDKKKLRQELEKSFIKRAVLKGALRGAAVGALGGAVGAALSDVVGHFFAPEKITKAAEIAKGTKDLAAETIKRETEAAAAQAYEKSVAAGLDSLRKNDFHIVAAKSEGQTQLARKLIRDFIAQDRALGSELELNKAQLIYAEDILQKNFARGPVELGQGFSIKGERILAAIEQAQNLSEEKLQNIQENFVPKISEETWEKITDYDSVMVDGEAIEAVKAEAEKKAAEAMGRAAEEAAQMIDQAKNITPEITGAKDAWFKDKWVKYGLGAVWVAAAAGVTALGYKLGRKSGRDVEGTASQDAPQVSRIGATGKLSKEGPIRGAGTQETPGVGTQKEIKTRTSKEELELENAIGDEIRQKFGVDIFIRSDKLLGKDQAYEGAKKLKDVLLANRDLVKRLGSVAIRIGEENMEPEKRKRGIGGDYIRITVDYSKSPEEMRRYLEESAEKAKKL